MLKSGYTIEDFNAIVGGDFLQKSQHNIIKHIVTDSRKFELREGCVFFALTGSRSNGHAYIKDLYHSGVRIFVVSQNLDLNNLAQATVILVDDTLQALQKFAAHHRDLFHFPVVGVTGSNGKTIVKEWAYQLLYRDFHIIRSPKSYNSQVGVPLSVLLMNENHNFGVFEAGISQPHEMQKLEKIIKPTIGIFTNIGPPHQENFSSVDEKIGEKLKLFAHSNVVIYCRDHNDIHRNVKRKLKSQNLLSWSMSIPADLTISLIEPLEKSTKLTGVYKGKTKSITVPFTSPASIENICHLWLLLLYLEMDDEKISRRFQELTSVAMRLEQLDGINGCVLINDAYNSDINSLTIALDYLKFQSKNKRYTAIVSDILQSGEDEQTLYTRVADLIRSRKIDRFFGIGKELLTHKSLFTEVEARFFETTSQFLKTVSKNDFSKENILLKGSRSFEFERIADFLQEKSHETVLEIDLTKMVENLNYVRSILHPATQIMAMVKAFAYGAGSYDVARILEYNRVDYLAVAYADEGVSLREDGITIPIMVLNPELSSYDTMIRYRLEPQIFSFRTLEYFLKSLRSSNESENYPIHIKINTGMNRLGFDLNDISKLGEVLANQNNVRVKSVFSHLAASDEEAFESFTRKQIEEFKLASEMLESKLNHRFLRHILNSSGILRYPDAQMDMVRLGLALYGITTHAEFQEKLQPVSSLKTVISQIREVKAGEGIGYSPKTRLVKNSKIAVIPVGYADGLPRLLGNGVGNVWIKNSVAPIVGNICMDMTMVDVTAVNCNEGDEVEVFGSHLDIYEMAEHLQTIPYEVLTNISQRVKRVFIQE